MASNRNSRRGTYLGLAFLVCLVLAVFHPVVGFDFINLDVTEQVTGVSETESFGWATIKDAFTWTKLSYYPVRSLTYAIDRHIWGKDSGGFKATNLLFHLASVCLLYVLILRLFAIARLPADGEATWRETLAAACGAGLFAIHPLVVEPVVWVPGREELLMTLAGLGAVHLHITARQLEAATAPRWKICICHVGTVVCCVLACLSNAVGVVLALLITALDRIVLVGRDWRKIFGATAALWGVAMITIILKAMATVEVEYEHPEYFSIERLVIISKAYSSNLAAILWPTNLTMDYLPFVRGPHWKLDVAVAIACVLATIGVVWYARRRQMFFFAVAWFLLALAPVAQVMPHHIHRADRFLYLPLVGLGILLATGILWVSRKIRSPLGDAALVGGMILLFAGLNYASSRQVWTWRDSISMWSRRLQVQPESLLAHKCLGDALAIVERLPEAAPHYEWVLARLPDDFRTLHNYAMYLALSPESTEKDFLRAIQMADRGFRITKGEKPRLRRTLSLAHMNYASLLRSEGRYGEAVEHLQAAMDADPEYQKPMLNLALLLASCEDPSIRSPQAAVKLAEKAISVESGPTLIPLSVLASIYAQAGDLAKAIQTLDRAIETARRDQATQWVEELETLKADYQRQANERD